jgi:hypothetical protein
MTAPPSQLKGIRWTNADQAQTVEFAVIAASA